MEPNRLIAALRCPQCGQESEMSVQVRYGPCAGYGFRLGEAVDWTREGTLWHERPLAPRTRIQGLTTCPACERMALEFGMEQFKSLRSKCKKKAGKVPRLKMTEGYRIGNYLTFLDMHHDLRQPIDLFGDVVTKPGRAIEKLSELVLGYPCLLFSHLQALVELTEDVFETVRFFPAAVQHALRQNPVGLHFGGVFADSVGLGALFEQYGDERSLEGMFRVSLKLEMLGLLAAHRDDPEELQEVPRKFRVLASSVSYIHPSLEPLARMPRDAKAGKILEAIERAIPNVPANPEPGEGESAGDPVALLRSYLESAGVP